MVADCRDNYEGEEAVVADGNINHEEEENMLASLPHSTMSGHFRASLKHRQYERLCSSYCKD